MPIKEDYDWCISEPMSLIQDDLLVAFHDAHAAAKIHILVCPKQHIISTKALRNSQADRDLREPLNCM